MINDNADRDQVVQRLAELLATNMKGSTNVVEEVYDYVPVNPGGISPFLAIQPSGSDRSRDDKQAAFLIFVHIYALYAMENTTITERDGWTALSQVEKKLAETLKSIKRAEGYWFDISWAEFSQVEPVALDNQGYLVEAIPLIIQSF